VAMGVPSAPPGQTPQNSWNFPRRPAARGTRCQGRAERGVGRDKVSVAVAGLAGVELAVDGARRDPEELRGELLVTPRVGQGLLDGLPLDLVQRCADGEDEAVDHLLGL